jgi:histidine triad (HIT) family protein
VAFEPLNPVTSGHLLVVPRQHVEDAGSHPLAASRTMALAAEIAGPLNWADSYNLITSAGAAATQTVKHLHIHLVPRLDGDGLALPWADRHADGWRDASLSLAAELDRRADRPGPAIAIGALHGAAEIARQSQNGPGTADGTDPPSSRTVTREQLADALARVKPAAVPQNGILEIDAEAMAAAIWEVLDG